MKRRDIEAKIARLEHENAGDYMKECLVSTDLWRTVQWEGVK